MHAKQKVSCDLVVHHVSQPNSTYLATVAKAFDFGDVVSLLSWLIIIDVCKRYVCVRSVYKHLLIAV